MRERKPRKRSTPLEQGDGQAPAAKLCANLDCTARTKYFRRGLCKTCYKKPELRKRFLPKGRIVDDLKTLALLELVSAARTKALPGSPEKVLVLMKRARLGWNLWNKLDATREE